LREVLRDRQVQVVFQPVVNLRTEEAVGFEALGRGTHRGLSPNPTELFSLAEKCRLAPDLSQLFRSVAGEEAARIPGPRCFFFNMHPSEMEAPSFLASLGEAAAAFRAAGRRMILEVHEDAVADVSAMARLCEQLRGLGVGLAYDDFGAGRDRLAQLAEVPPEFIKLDMGLIRGIDRAPARQDLVLALGELAGPPR